MDGLNNPHEIPPGFLVLDKPHGMSSMKAISIVRRKAGGMKTGHAGTLDPLATGVLVVALGRATKSINLVMDTRKRYQTTIDLTAFTTTDDREGDRTEIEVAKIPSEDDLRAALEGFRGRSMQKPPAYSAMKVGGRRAYKLARQGQPPELEPREVMVHELEVTRYAWPDVQLEMLVDKGFYVRSLARDLGEALSTGGHCASIRRTEVGPFTIQDAIDPADLPDPLTDDRIIGMESLDRLLSG